MKMVGGQLFQVRFWRRFNMKMVGGQLFQVRFWRRFNMKMVGGQLFQVRFWRRFKMKMVGGQLFQVKVLGNVQDQDGGRATLSSQVSNFYRKTRLREKN